jgi:DNA-binding GntR family transcriptional regulator
MLHAVRTDQLTEAFRRDLLAGIFDRDGRLTIDSLAVRYGVSHMPVREALRELAGEGLVTLETNRGARARPVDVAFVRQLFETRIALEVMLVRAAARHVTRDTLAALEAIENLRCDDVAAGRFDAAITANADLHTAIYRLSGNSHACALVDRHWRFIAALWARHGHVPERFSGVANDHRHILLALRAQDGDAAGVLMAAHVLKAQQELLELVGRNMRHDG